MAVVRLDFKQNRTTDAARRPSPAIWADCPVEELMQDPGKGLYFFDDFTDLPLIGTQTTQIGFGKYKVFNTGAGVVTRISTVNSVELEGGCLKNGLDTDNDSGSLAQAYPGFFLSGSSSTSGKLWFECCFSQNSVVTNMASTFIGLAETDQMTLATAVPLNAGDPITNTWSGIGFRVAEDGLGVVDTVYSDRATSFTNVGATEGGTLVAYTFKKFGFVYDPERSADCIRFYADNLQLTTAVSSTTLTGTTNLKANCLGLVMASVADSAGTSFEGYLKWWRCAQLMP